MFSCFMCSVCVFFFLFYCIIFCRLFFHWSTLHHISFKSFDCLCRYLINCKIQRRLTYTFKYGSFFLSPSFNLLWYGSRLGVLNRTGSEKLEASHFYNPCTLKTGILLWMFRYVPFILNICPWYWVSVDKNFRETNHPCSSLTFLWLNNGIVHLSWMAA